MHSIDCKQYKFGDGGFAYGAPTITRMDMLTQVQTPAAPQRRVRLRNELRSNALAGPDEGGFNTIDTRGVRRPGSKFGAAIMFPPAKHGLAQPPGHIANLSITINHDRQTEQMLRGALEQYA